MNSSCLFCHGALGTNDVIERFPVGRRLAFDSAKGRLWVVCGKCAQWNLTPIEERWEAVEDCERRFRAARLRASTAEIGLAQLPEGLRLIRIGAPLRPEFVAWRYGDALRRRRRRWLAGGGTMLAAGIGAAGMASGWVLPPLPELSFFSLGGVVPGLFFGIAALRMRQHMSDWRVLSEAGVPDAFFDTMSRNQRIVLARAPAPDGWRLHIERGNHTADLVGSAAYRAVGSLLPLANTFGASRRDIDQAVGLLDANIDPHDHFAKVVDQTCRRGFAYAELPNLPPTLRLSLEIAAHEESERRALAGELAALAEQWRRAEEIAGIADNLLLPASVLPWLARHRRSKSAARDS